jgi:hypothetical protein
MSTLTAIRTTKTRSSRIPIARVLLYLLVLSFPFFGVEPKIFRPDWWIGGALIVVFAFSVLARGRLRVDPMGHAVLWFNAAVLLSTAVNFWSSEAAQAQWVEFLTLWLQLIFATLLYFEWALGFAGYVRSSSVLREPTDLGNYLLGPLLIAAILTLF